MIGACPKIMANTNPRKMAWSQASECGESGREQTDAAHKNRPSCPRGREKAAQLQTFPGNGQHQESGPPANHPEDRPSRQPETVSHQPSERSDPHGHL